VKKFFVLFLLVFCINFAFAQNSMGIDKTIEEMANFLNERIPARTSVAVFDFSSDSRMLSDYIADELVIALANTGMDVYDRKNLDKVNREIYYGMGDAVDENTAQMFGRDVGAQTVILGSFTKYSNTEYRLRVQAIVVETKRIQAGKTFNVKQDKQLLSLMPKPEKDYEGLKEFGRNLGYGFLNPLFGLGSYLQDDFPVGMTLTLSYLASGILLLIEFGAFDYWADGAGVCGTIGLGIASAALLLGFIRPFVFSQYGDRWAQVPGDFYLAVVPVASGGVGMSVGYSVKF